MFILFEIIFYNFKVGTKCNCLLFFTKFIQSCMSERGSLCKWSSLSIRQVYFKKKEIVHFTEIKTNIYIYIIIFGSGGSTLGPPGKYVTDLWQYTA